MGVDQGPDADSTLIGSIGQIIAIPAVQAGILGPIGIGLLSFIGRKLKDLIARV
jgi:hypothetical protein